MLVLILFNSIYAWDIVGNLSWHCDIKYCFDKESLCRTEKRNEIYGCYSHSMRRWIEVRDEERENMERFKQAREINER